MVHDKMCEDHSKINYNRNLSSNIFKALLKGNGTPFIKAEVMSWCVDFYQIVFSDTCSDDTGIGNLLVRS